MPTGAGPKEEEDRGGFAFPLRGACPVCRAGDREILHWTLDWYDAEDGNEVSLAGSGCIACAQKQSRRRPPGGRVCLINASLDARHEPGWDEGTRTESYWRAAPRDKPLPS